MYVLAGIEQGKTIYVYSELMDFTDNRIELRLVEALSEYI